MQKTGNEIPSVAVNWEMQIESAYNNFNAPDIESAIATFCGYVEQHYNDLFEEIRTPAGKEWELIVNDEVHGRVVGVNPAGTSFVLKGEGEEDGSQNVADVDDDEFWDEEDPFADGEEEDGGYLV